MTEQQRPFTKGHGTENDFVLIPDLDGSADLTPAQVVFLADRRAGIGGDGVIRVVATGAAKESGVREQAGAAKWFMDYRNSDGSIAEMCGNGTRVFASYLRREKLEMADVFSIATRAGTKMVTFEDDATIAVNLGPWRAVTPPNGGVNVVVVGQTPIPAVLFDLGNPHTVVRLPEDIDLDTLDLSRAPHVRPLPPEGTNVELVHVIGPGHLRMRVHERGVGETRSCGTGAAAAALAAREWSRDEAHGAPAETVDVWRVDVPGGSLRVTALAGSEVELAGPAELVADGVVRIS